MLDFDNENNGKDLNGIAEERETDTAREADDISAAETSYDENDVYEKYGFKNNDSFNHSQYHTDKSYANVSHSEEQKKRPAPEVRGWTAFFRSLPYPMITVVIYLIVGFVCKAWHPAWIIFLTIPAYYSIVEHYIQTGKIRFPLFTIVLIAYLLMGTLGDLWHPGWIVFFALPLYFVFDNLMKIKHTRLIIYTLVCIAIYVLIGVTLKLWHPTWIIFLTIPIFESLYNSTAKLIKEKRAERAEKEGEKPAKKERTFKKHNDGQK